MMIKVNDSLKKKKTSRAEKAGEELSKSIIKIIDSMYETNTAKNFLKGLIYPLFQEYNKRLGDEIPDDPNAALIPND